jgi:hypothetical protein
MWYTRMDGLWNRGYAAGWCVPAAKGAPAQAGPTLEAGF